jgi:hypothetical protein
LKSVCLQLTLNSSCTWKNSLHAFYNLIGLGGSFLIKAV